MKTSKNILNEKEMELVSLLMQAAKAQETFSPVKSSFKRRLRAIHGNRNNIS